MLSSLVEFHFPMDTHNRVSAPEAVEEFFGGVLDYEQHGPDRLLSEAMKRLTRQRAFSVINFPTNKDDFAAFCTQFGNLMPSYGNAELQDVFGIGDVIFNPKKAEGEQLPKERLGPLPFHTGRAWAVQRPRYLAMLMKSTGTIGNDPGLNGESMLLRSRDAVAELRVRYPDDASEDFLQLLSTAVRFKADHVLEEPDTYPLIFNSANTAEDEDICFRYKINILPILCSTRESLGLSSRYINALERFDEVVQTTDQSLIYQMLPGHLTFVDNARIAHGRRSVQPVPGSSEVRHLLNAQIL